MFSIQHTPDEAELDDQLDIPERLRDHSLIIGFAPVENPQIAIVTVVEHASFADNIARKVIDDYFKEQRHE